MTLNFREYLKFKNVRIKTDSINSAKLIGYFREYLDFGGFPRPTLSPHRFRELISTYFGDIIIKDIAARHRLDSYKVEKTIKLAVSYFSKEFNLNKLASAARVDHKTVEDYLNYAKDAFLIHILPKYEISPKKAVRSPRKMYVADNGLINVVAHQGLEQKGMLLENAVAVELLRRGYKPGQDLFYWKGKQEIDFLLRRGLQVQGLINVAWDVGDENTKKREVEGMVEGLKKFRLKEGMVITYDYEDEVQIGAKRVRFVPAWKWMLGL